MSQSGGVGSPAKQLISFRAAPRSWPGIARVDCDSCMSELVQLLKWLASAGVFLVAELLTGPCAACLISSACMHAEHPHSSLIRACVPSA